MCTEVNDLFNYGVSHSTNFVEWLNSEDRNVIRANLLRVTSTELCLILKFTRKLLQFYDFYTRLAALAQVVACLPLVQQVRGSIPGRVVNFHLKIFNLGARKGGDVLFLIARLYITDLD